MTTERSTDFQLFRRVLGEARPYRWHIVGLLFLNLLAMPLALLTPLPLKIGVDSAIGSEPLPGFLAFVLPDATTQSASGVVSLVCALVICIAALTQLQSLASSLLRTYTGEKLMLAFRARLFRHVQRLSMAYHDAIGTWDSTYRIQYDAAAVQYIAIDGVIPFITAALTLFSMFMVCFRIDWQLALVALAVSPVLFLLTRTYKARLRSKYRNLKKRDSAALAVVQEVLGALRVVKAFGQENREQDRFVNQFSESIRARVGVTIAEGILGCLMGLTTAAGTAAVLFIGIRHVQTGVLTLGNLLLVMGYLSQLYGPLKTISNKISTLQSHLEGAERAYALLDKQQDVPEHPHARRLKRALGNLSLCHVSFAYDQDSMVLDDVSFEVPAGTRVGIAGKTGVGKTTLVNLLMRFYDPTAGRILLEGVDLRDYKLADLRNQFAIVQQDPVLFSATIAENIAYADPACNEQQIQAAAMAANAHDFIVNLSDGYGTLVGERGMRLSGGERQRIALARAFLKDAPILILDEPTSSVDIKTEAGILDAMRELMKGRTTFIIAHRTDTLESCDTILHLDGGKLNKALDYLSVSVSQVYRTAATPIKAVD